MAHKRWTFELEDGQHSVELEHGFWSGKRAIRIDGKLVERTAKLHHLLCDIGSAHQFEVGGHSCALHIFINWQALGLPGYSLVLDGRPIPEQELATYDVYALPDIQHMIPDSGNSRQLAGWDDELSILSAENVNFALETAGLGSRFAAAMIDLTLQALTLTLLLIAAAYFVSYFLPDIASWSRWALSIGAAIGLLILFLILYGYYFFFEWLWDGQTPGKRWLGLRVLQTSGMPLTAWAAMTRNLFRIIDFLPVFYGLGAIVAWLNPHNRRIGDLIAGTVVARERRAGKRAPILDITAASNALLGSGSTPAATGPESTAPADITFAPGVMLPPVEPPSSAVDANLAALLARLDQQDYELLQQFLARRDALAPAVRARLAHSLAARLSAKLGESMPAPVEPFLEAVAVALQHSRPGS